MAVANAAAMAMSKSPDAVPDSEERVYLYQKSGTESLQELEAKRKRYVDLDESLVRLPQKLRHPGLIPLGPGLFGHGKLIRTNEIMVLLGDSYFAEMSAHEARAVVKRRIALIDEKIGAVEVGKGEVEEILAKEKEKIELESKEKVSKSKYLGFKKGFLNIPQVEEKFVSGNKPPKSPRPISSSPSPSKKRVSFSGDTKGGEYESAETNGTENTMSAKAMVNELLKNFQGSVALAEEQLGQDETVNFEEVFDADGKFVEVRGIDSSNVNLEEQNGVYEPDAAQAELIPEVECDTDFDCESGREIEGGKLDEESYTRSDYLDALLKYEREEEERERIEEEVETFGSGLKRGFLDSPAEKKEIATNGDMDVERSRGRIAVENTVKERTGRRRRGRKAEGRDLEGAKVFSVGEEEKGSGSKRISRFKQSRLKSAN